MAWLEGRTRPHRTLLLAAGFATALILHAAASTLPVHRVGAVTRHASKFIGQTIALKGYVLAWKTGYVLFSDEPDGSISRYDLPVVGDGAEQMKAGKRYIIEGVFLDHGLAASNGNPDHLELSAPPTQVSQ